MVFTSYANVPSRSSLVFDTQRYPVSERDDVYSVTPSARTSASAFFSASAAPARYALTWSARLKPASASSVACSQPRV